ncbi:DNA-3-methyladenine glycosylase [Candidatus Woesearchaeota archaeon]|nr:DNA-3-methyladenine glycosylase [Candidatus Woesearchaeota archaeon]
MTNLKKSDFEDNSDIVARNLLGRYLSLRQQSGEIIRARLREIAAYEGSGIRTSRKIGYSAGTVSISTKFGRKLFDIATGREGEFSCVTIRAVDLEDLTFEGPGNVTKTLGIDKFTQHLYDGVPAYGDVVWINGNPVDESEIYEIKINSTNCKGIYRF